MWVPSLGQEDTLEWEIATCSGILAWKIQWSLAGCIPWDLKELDMTEYARAYTHTHQTVDPLHLFCPWITFPTGNHYSALSVSLFLFYFVCWIFFFCFRFHIWVKPYSICLWLTSLSIMPSESILVTDGKISFFMAVNIGMYLFFFFKGMYLFESVFPCPLKNTQEWGSWVM